MQTHDKLQIGNRILEVSKQKPPVIHIYNTITAKKSLGAIGIYSGFYRPIHAGVSKDIPETEDLTRKRRKL